MEVGSVVIVPELPPEVRRKVGLYGARNNKRFIVASDGMAYSIVERLPLVTDTELPSAQ